MRLSCRHKRRFRHKRKYVFVRCAAAKVEKKIKYEDSTAFPFPVIHWYETTS